MSDTPRRGQRRLRRLLLSLGISAGLAVTAGPALADADPGAPSGDGVQPTYYPDNPDVGDIGLGYGFKIDKSPNGTFMFVTGAGTELTGGAPSDPSNSVTISNSNNVTFDWSSTIGVDAVIVKGGPNADAYVYN